MSFVLFLTVLLEILQSRSLLIKQSCSSFKYFRYHSFSTFTKLSEKLTFRTPNTLMPGVVACTCNPATLEAKFRNSVGSIPVGGNSPSIGGWIV